AERGEPLLPPRSAPRIRWGASPESPEWSWPAVEDPTPAPSPGRAPPLDACSPLTAGSAASIASVARDLDAAHAVPRQFDRLGEAQSALGSRAVYTTP